MNERIVKLFMESVDSNYIPVPVEDHIPSWTEKFAELIVRECAGVTLDYKNDDYYNGWCDHSAEILEQFGVK